MENFSSRWRLSDGQAHALTALARHASACRIPWGTEGHLWDCALRPGVVPEISTLCQWWIGIEWTGARLVLCLPPHAVQAWVEARHPDTEFTALPESILACALEGLLDEVMAALGTAGTGSARITRIADQAFEVPAHAWTLQCQMGDSVSWAVVYGDDLALLLLGGLASRLPPSPATLDTRSIPVVLTAVLGTTRLPAARLRTLTRGDVVLLEHNRILPEGRLWLSAGTGQGLQIGRIDDHFVVTQAWTNLMDETRKHGMPDSNTGSAAPDNDQDLASPAAGDVSASDEQAPDADAPLAVDAVPVVLSFDLGRRSMTLEHLSRLQLGEVFDLGRPLADGPVRVRANGAWIADGELVEIDGRIGVRLSRLGGSQP